MPTLASSTFLQQNTTAGTALVTGSITVADGDVIVVKLGTWSTSTAMGAPITVGQTYTSRVINAPGAFNEWCGIYTAVITGSPGTITVSSTPAGSARYSMTVERWTSAQLAGSPVTNSLASTGAAASTITPAQATSVISWCSGDAGSIDPATRTYLASGSDEGVRDGHSGANGVEYYGWQAAVGTSSQSYGLSLPAGQTFVIAGIEIQAASGGTVDPEYPLPGPAPGRLAPNGVWTLWPSIDPPTSTAWFADSTLAVTATLAAGASLGAASASSLSVTATLTAAATAGPAANNTLAVTAGTSASAVLAAAATASLAVTATLAGAAQTSESSTGSLAVTATLIAAAQSALPAAAALPVTATLTAAASRGQSVTSTLAATANLTAAAQSSLIGASTLAVTATLTAAGIVTSAGSAAAVLAATATLTASAQSSQLAAATLPVTATLAAAASRGQSVAGPLAVTATFAAAAQSSQVAAAALTVTAALSAAAQENRPAAGSLNVVATTAAAAQSGVSAAAALTVTATLTAAGTVTSAGPKFADASLTVTATLTAGGAVVAAVRTKAGSWWSLVSVLKEARLEAAQPDPKACPNDGEPLRLSEDGYWFCLFDNFVLGDVPVHRNVAGSDWGGLQGVINSTKADASEDRGRLLLACPNDGEPFSTSVDGIRYCRFDGFRPDGGEIPLNPSTG